MKVKILSKVLALCCALALILTGCGTVAIEESVWMEGDGTTQTVHHSSGQKGSVTKVDDSGRTEVDSIQSNGKAANLKGATVTIGYYLTSYCGEPQASSPTYQDEVKLISDIEKKYNCKIEFRYVGDPTVYYKAWTTAAQAGTHFADIIQMATNVVYPTHMKAGYLTKLDDYIDAKDIIYNQNAMKQTAYNGSNYITVMSNRMYSPVGLFFNKKVFETFNQKTPDTYVDANNWNWDTFVEVAKATTGSDNGVDYYGYGYEATDPVYWAISNGGKKVIKKDGRYVFNMGSSQYLKGIQFAYELYNTHKVTAPKVKSAEFLWGDGKIAMYLSLPGKGASHMEKLGSKNVGFTYIPKGPDVKDYVATVEETTAFAIPSTVSNPEAISQVMYDFTYPYKWRATLEESLETHMGDAKSLKAAMNITNIANANMDLMPTYSYIREVSISGFGILEQTSPQGFVASVEAAAQAEIDSVWGQ